MHGELCECMGVVEYIGRERERKNDVKEWNGKRKKQYEMYNRMHIEHKQMSTWNDVKQHVYDFIK